MYFGHLIKSVSKKYKKIPISGISFDSRKVKKKNIFFAIQGNKISGTEFINDAILKGASAVDLVCGFSWTLGVRTMDLVVDLLGH